MRIRHQRWMRVAYPSNIAKYLLGETVGAYCIRPFKQALVQSLIHNLDIG